MAEPWFHLPELPAVGDRATLDGREARHAAGARRLQPGAPLRLFDGAGRVAEAAVERVGQGGRELVVAVRRLEDAPVLAPGRHLICSMPKGERQGVLLSMATQLGITTFTPLHAERTVARGGEKQRARARRIVVEACKQSRRAHLPEIRPALTPAAIAAAPRRRDAILVAHPGGTRFRDALEGLGPEPDEVTLVVGPEGGLSEDEVEALHGGGARLVDLGEGILRVETAAVAMLAAVALWIGRTGADVAKL